MARYYFDFRDGDNLVVDDEGSDLANAEQAREEAIALLPAIARDRLPDGEHRQFVVIMREGDTPLYQATLTFEGKWLIK